MRHIFKFYVFSITLLLFLAITAGSSTALAKILTIENVTDSSHDGNIPANMTDYSITTRWSAEGDGQWVEYDLGADNTPTQVLIASNISPPRDLTIGGTQTISSISKDNITWTFNGGYPTGQFTSGDWYVVAPSGLQVTNITAGGGETLAGSMLNPDPNIGNQGLYDTTGMSTVVPYDPSLNVGTSLPLSLSPGDMLVTATEYGYYGVTNPQNKKNYTHVNEATILTILSAAPASGSFRPGLCDTSRTIYNESDINYTLFATLTPVSGAPSLSTVADMVARPWLDFIPGWRGRQIHPNNNMKDYGGEISVDLATIALILNSNYTNAEKAPIARGFIQIGLDCWSIVKRNPTRYQMDIAHNVGRKLPILLAGELLNISEIKAIWAKAGQYVNTTYGTYPSDAYLFSEDMAINYVAQGDIDETTSGSAAYSPDVDYSSSLLGMPEWFHYPYAYRYRSTAYWTADNYRLCCYSGTLEGDAIVIYAMGLNAKWNHQAFFDYMDRFVAIADGNADPFGYTVPGEASGYRGSWQSDGGWMSAMWNRYRAGFN